MFRLLFLSPTDQLAPTNQLGMCLATEVQRRIGKDAQGVPALRTGPWQLESWRYCQHWLTHPNYSYVHMIHLWFHDYVYKYTGYLDKTGIQSDSCRMWIWSIKHGDIMGYYIDTTKIGLWHPFNHSIRKTKQPWQWHGVIAPGLTFSDIISYGNPFELTGVKTPAARLWKLLTWWNFILSKWDAVSKDGALFW